MNTLLWTLSSLLRLNNVLVPSHSSSSCTLQEVTIILLKLAQVIPIQLFCGEIVFVAVVKSLCYRICSVTTNASIWNVTCELDYRLMYSMLLRPHSGGQLMMWCRRRLLVLHLQNNRRLPFVRRRICRVAALLVDLFRGHLWKKGHSLGCLLHLGNWSSGLLLSG